MHGIYCPPLSMTDKLNTSGTGHKYMLGEGKESRAPVFYHLHTVPLRGRPLPLACLFWDRIPCHCRLVASRIPVPAAILLHLRVQC